MLVVTVPFYLLGNEGLGTQLVQGHPVGGTPDSDLDLSNSISTVLSANTPYFTLPLKMFSTF